MEPSFVWRTYLGGSLLARWRGLPPCPDGHFPEDWLCSMTRANNPGREDIPEGDSILTANVGNCAAAITLRELLAQDPAAYLGAEHLRRFGMQTGLLVKLLDSAIRLPIQAHPNRRDAQRLFGSRYGKTESWYVLDTRPEVAEPYVLLGFRQGVTREQWLAAYRSQDIPQMRSMLHRLRVRKGELYLVQPGVPHAIGEGCLLVETQEPSDLVYRTEKKNAAGQYLSDEICTMGIGVEAMMDQFVYGGASEQETRARYQLQPKLLQTGEAGTLTSLLGPEDTDRFAVQRLNARAAFPCGWESFGVAIITAGKGALQCAAGRTEIQKGETWFLPAGVEAPLWVPDGELEVLLCLPPKEL